MDKLTLEEVLTLRLGKCSLCSKVFMLIGGVCQPCKEELDSEPLIEEDNHVIIRDMEGWEKAEGFINRNA